MFADAVAKAKEFTKPLITSHAPFRNSPVAGNGSLIIVNDEGWFISAAHLFAAVVKAQNDAPELQKYVAARAAIEQNPTLHPKDKAQRVKKLAHDDSWITGYNFWWLKRIDADPEPLTASFLQIDMDRDLAIGRLDNFDQSCVNHYPTFKKPENIRPGTSLCRLGFPFARIDMKVDHANQTIDINVDGLSFFPNDGIFTREPTLKKDSQGNDVRILETSSPGLRGQSGGPIFDGHGHVWSVQSMTAHVSLGFDPPDPGNPNRTVHQFMNVGIGVHPETIWHALITNKVKFDTER